MVLDKSEVKYAMEKIAKKLQGQKSMTIREHENKAAWNVLRELLNDKKKQFVWNDITYNLEYHPSTSTIENRSSTYEFTVTKHSAKEVYDLDVLLAKKEIKVVDWRGGTERLDGLGLDKRDGKYVYLNDDVVLNQIIEAIINNSAYNIMILRHDDTGDVTVAIDNHRFQQR